MLSFLKPLVHACSWRRHVRPIVCVYTCEAHRDLHDAFFDSPVVAFLQEELGCRWFEVVADPGVKHPVWEEQRLTVPSVEAYGMLPRKTFEMIRAMVESQEFTHLIKIDITTLTTALHRCGPPGGAPTSVEAFLRYLQRNDVFKVPYHGLTWVVPERKGMESWAAKKQLDVDFDGLFGEAPLPSFYSGKLYVIRRDFAEMISEQGKAVVDLYQKAWPAEDVMVGALFRIFESGRSVSL